MGDWRKISVLHIEREHKKICIWKDEMPFMCKGEEKVFLHALAGETNWYNGVIAVEARLGARFISNYAMIFMKYIYKQQNTTDIIIHYGNEKRFYQSQVLPENKKIYIGLEKEFAEAIEEFFEKYTMNKLPSGIIEILGGGYNEIASSNNSFKKVMALLFFIFEHIDVLMDEQLQQELLDIIC